MISHNSFQVVSDTGPVIHVQTPGDFKIPIGFLHCDIYWDSGLNCGRRRETREVSFSRSTLTLWDWISLFRAGADFQLTKRESTQLTVMFDADDFGGQVFSSFPNCCIVILSKDKTHIDRATTLSLMALLDKAIR